MHSLAATYSESFQKKRLAMTKLFHEEPLQVNDKRTAVFIFLYHLSLPEIWDEVIISIFN